MIHIDLVLYSAREGLWFPLGANNGPTSKVGLQLLKSTALEHKVLFLVSYWDVPYAGSPMRTKLTCIINEVSL